MDGTTYGVWEDAMRQASEPTEAAVERACQAIYREFEGYWPSNVERAHIRAALGSTIEVDWQAENERLREGVRTAARALYAIEVHRQSCGWDDDLTARLVTVQHDLAALHNDTGAGDSRD